MLVDSARILVVEPELLQAQVLMGLLITLGYEPGDCATAAEAVEIMSAQEPGAVLVSLDLPHGGAHALLRALRSHGLTSPAIVYGNVTTVDDVIMLMREGASDLLHQPINAVELGSSLLRALARRPSARTPFVAPQRIPPSPAVAVAPEPLPSRSPRRTTPRPANIGRLALGVGAREPRPRRLVAEAEAAPQYEEPQAPPPPPPPKSRAVLAQEQADIVRALEEELVNGRLSLPPLAPLSAELSRLSQEPHLEVAEVETLVARDPGLAAVLLHRTNSTMLRGRRPVTNLRAACLRVGNRGVLAVAQEVVLSRTFSSPGSLWQGESEAMWRNVLLTARLARALAEPMAHPDPEGAYLAGLLHNLGEIVALHLLAEACGGQSGGPLGDQATAFIRENHEELGGRLLAAWSMHQPLVALARQHHEAPRRPESHEARRLRILVETAWRAACQAGAHYIGDRGLELPEVEPGDLGIARTTWNELLEEARRSAEETELEAAAH